MQPQRVPYLLVFLICASLLAFGYYLEFGQGLDPCPLCIIQRLFFALVGVVALIAAIHGPRKTGVRVYSTLIALFALGGAIVAGRQVWLQHLPPDKVPECGPGLEFMLQAYPFGKTIRELFHGSGECAEAAWTFLTLSIAEWSLLCFIGLLLAALIHIARPVRKAL